jgi:hypothetical protein
MYHTMRLCAPRVHFPCSWSGQACRATAFQVSTTVQFAPCGLLREGTPLSATNPGVVDQSFGPVSVPNCPFRPHRRLETRHPRPE